MRQAKDYIIFPLDVPSVKEAQKYIEVLSGHIGMFKVGLELFIRSGHEVIKMIKDSGDVGIFLDLKLHDIPVTVKHGMESIADLGVTFATVHCGETPRMLEHAVEGSQGKVGVLGVTVLTSISEQDISNAGFLPEYSEDITRLVIKRATMAKDAGCSGIVCSGKEVKMIKEKLGKDFKAITPGIRPAWNTTDDDQRRITTPAMAVRDGSDYLVIGRPIRDADDPVEAARKVAEEVETVL